MNYTSTMQTNTNGRSLPKGWRWVKIGEIAEVSTGGTPNTNHPEYYGGSIRWLKSGDVKGTYIDEVPNRISQLGLDNSNARIHPVGSVMLAMSGQGKTRGTSAILRVASACSQSVAAILPTKHAIPEIIHYALVNRYDETRRITGDDERTGLNLRLIREMEIPLPPLDNQRQIASRLDKQLAAVGSARKAAQEQLQAAQELPSAYFRKAFLGITPLTASTYRDEAPERWAWKKLTTIARLESGHTPSRYHAEWWGGSIPWIALPDIRALDRKVAYETLEYTNEQGIANSSARVLPAGTVCLSRTASVGFVTIMGREMATSQDFVNWVCGPELDPYFLMYLFLASRDYFRSISSGAIHKTVYMPTAKALEVCIPPVGEQKRIAEFLKAKLAASDKLINTLESQLAEINRLPASLLREAFEGGV
jgi:type I restriction enzyme S subunit